MDNGQHQRGVIHNGSKPDDDVASTLAELREQVREARARLSYGGPDDPRARSLAEMRHSADAVNDTWFVSAHLPITWDLRIVGRLGAYAKRLVRVLLRWYINPVVEQQNRFNSATARAIVEIIAYQERMTREWQLLDERIAGLERKIED